MKKAIIILTLLPLVGFGCVKNTTARTCAVGDIDMERATELHYEEIKRLEGAGWECKGVKAYKEGCLYTGCSK